MATHTPGPWVLNGLWPSGPGFSVTADGKGYHIAGCGAYQHSHPGAAFTDEECRANGRLIAAAPDLLAALKAMVASYDGLRDGITSAVVLGKLAAADAAIAKAEGAK